MPIWLRKFTFIKIQEWFDEKNKQSQSSQSDTTNILDSTGKITPPQFNKKTSYK